MIVIKISGGLGNQMLKYAYGRSLELSGKKIIFDISFFHGYKASRDVARDFKLDKFNLQTQVKFSQKKHIFLDLWIKLKRKLGFKITTDYPNEKHFIIHTDEIRQEFVLKKELSNSATEILQKIETENSIALHIRHGDFVTNKITHAYHGVCNLTYYHIAIKTIKEKIYHPIFFIFSDDIAWAKANFSGEEFVFVSSPTTKDYEELILMSRCYHQIIANSSFSWWGAWLNRNPHKVVIAPKKWFNSKRPDSSEIIPDNWIKL
jgi:hypothetical protein